MKFRFRRSSKKPNYRTRIVTFCAGIAVLIFVIIEAICKAAAGPRPSLDQGASLVNYMSVHSTLILWSVVADTFVLAAMTTFLAGLFVLAYRKLGHITMAMVVGALFTMIYASITIFGDSFDAGTAINATQSVGDASVIRTLIEAHTVVFGPVGGIVLTFVATASGLVILESKVLPRWVGIVGFFVAILNIIAIAALFGFYKDWDTKIAFYALVSCVVWVVAASIALVVPVLKSSR